MTQHRLYLQCSSLVNIWLSSSFETSPRFLRGAGLAASHVNSHWWTQDALYLRKHDKSEPEECDRIPVIVVEWEGWNTLYPVSASKSTVKTKPRPFSMRNHNDFSGVGGGDVQIYNQNEAQAHFTWENTTISPGLVGVTFKFTIKMKPRRVLHEKTQRFLRGWRGWHLNLQPKWSPGVFYMRKHNDFSGVGGGDI